MISSIVLDFGGKSGVWLFLEIIGARELIGGLCLDWSTKGGGVECGNGRGVG